MGSCFLVRGQGFRADFTARSGTPPGTRSPTSDPMRHHVYRSGFGGTCGILCRRSISGPGASLGIVTSMRDSMWDPASSYVVRDSVRTSLPDPGPHPGPGAPTVIQCGTTYLDRDSEVHVAFNAGSGNSHGRFHEFHACCTSLPPPWTVLKALYRHCRLLALV